MTKKRSVVLFFSTIFLLTLIIPLFVGCSSQEKLVIGNWADYIENDVINDFKIYYKEITGKDIKVEYDDTFITTEDMLLKSGRQRYDLICPSDYTVEKMIKGGVLYPLEKNLGVDINGNEIEDYRSNITKLVKDRAEFDPNLSYSSPYMWSTMGISYNVEEIEKLSDTALDDVKSWDILWNEKYKNKVKMKDSRRDAYLIAAIKVSKQELLSGDKTVEEVINDNSPQMIAKVKAALIEQKLNGVGYESDEGKQEVIDGTIAALPQWSGDAVYSIYEAERLNKNVDYSIPEEGSNLFFDAWVIPKTAKNLKAANLFINFLARDDIAIRNMDYIGYISCVATENVMNWLNETYEAWEPIDLSYFFGDIEGSNNVRVDSRQFPTAEILERCAVMRDFPSGKDIAIEEMWTSVKAS